MHGDDRPSRARHPLLIASLTSLSLSLQLAAAGLIANPLADTRWQLQEFVSMDDSQPTLRPRDSSVYTLQLNGDGSVFMALDCNLANGTWSAQPGQEEISGGFSFGPLAMTRALCPPPDLDEQLGAQSQYVRSYLLEDSRLFLSLMADGGVYAWTPLTYLPAAPEDGGPRNLVVSISTGVLNLRAQRTTTAEILTTYPDQTLLDNLGCSEDADRIWCDVQKLGGGPRGYVAAEFLRPAVAPDGSVARGPDDSALRAGQGDFDASGRVPCAAATGQPMGECEFQVARAGGGYATVVINRSDGGQRIVFFRMGIPIGFSQSETEGYAVFRADKEADLHTIRIGTERYEIPDAVILGG